MSSTPHFKFTRDTGRLSLEQRIFYERNGYLVFPRFIPDDVLQRCSQRFDNVVAGKVPSGNMIVMRDVVDRKSVSKIQDINFDEGFKEYIEHKDLLDVVQAFTGPNIMAVHNMLIAKPPDIGSGSSRHPPHQDLYYFPFRPTDWIVAAWTAIEPCDKQNGCLYVAPGSHISNDLLSHGYPKGSFNKFYHGIQSLSDATFWIDLEMQPGDTVFFHPLLIHGSGKNVSNRTRKAISCHYASAACSYIEVAGTVQETIKNEVEALVEKRFGGDSKISYPDVWRIKSTLVRGLRSNL